MPKHSSQNNYWYSSWYSKKTIIQISCSNFLLHSKLFIWHTGEACVDNLKDENGNDLCPSSVDKCETDEEIQQNCRETCNMCYTPGGLSSKTHCSLSYHLFSQSVPTRWTMRAVTTWRIKAPAQRTGPGTWHSTALNHVDTVLRVKLYWVSKKKFPQSITAVMVWRGYRDGME